MVLEEPSLRTRDLSDRVKDMIISGGETVYCVEVENAIHRHPAVLECALFGIPHERWGEQVHAAIVLRPDAACDPDEIVEHCRTLIAGCKLPRSIELHDELPKSGAGKVLKRDLRPRTGWAATGRSPRARAAGAQVGMLCGKRKRSCGS